jgi:tryptophan-rich sensory protein
VKRENIIKLVVSILVCQGAGLVGSVFNIASIPTWYTTINKPIFNPPNWIFAPGWTTLFVLMGIALYLVWREGYGKKQVKRAMSAFSGQLILNILWSALFFGLRSPALAFAEIVALWVAIFITIKEFKKISKTAAWLLVPYIVWVSFAAILNLSIVLLNL